MKVAVYTRSNNPVLWERMCEFIPQDVIKYRCTGFHGFEAAVEYLYYMFEHAVENKVNYIINIDEDCFITDWNVVLNLLKYTKDNSFTHVGMPDGCVHPGRSNSWAVHNPFFNVFNVVACSLLIRSKSKEFINSFTFYGIKKATRPKERGTFEHNNDEPFAGLFYYLHAKGKPLNLSAYIWADGITTELLFKEIPFCVHTWYSREYGFDENVTNRIDTIYENCRNRVLVG
jgi:hypothetical protein